MLTKEALAKVQSDLAFSTSVRGGMSQEAEIATAFRMHIDEQAALIDKLVKALERLADVEYIAPSHRNHHVLADELQYRINVATAALDEARRVTNA